MFPFFRGGQEKKEEEKNGGEKLPEKTVWLLVLLGGVLLLTIAWPVKKNQTEEKSTSWDYEEIKTDSPDDIAGRQKKELEQVLSMIQGAGKVEVMISYRDDGTKVVEKDRTTENRTVTNQEENETVTQEEKSFAENTVSGGSDGTPFISHTLLPEVEGILVVAEGGEDAKVRQQICDAVQALFPLEVHKIVVVKMKNQED